MAHLRRVALPLLLFLLVEAVLFAAAPLQPRWEALYVIVGAVALYWFVVRCWVELCVLAGAVLLYWFFRFGNPRRPATRRRP